MNTNEIAARITEIEGAMKNYGFFSAERKALEDELKALIRERNNLFAAAKASPSVQSVSLGRRKVDPEFAVTADTWEQMHG